jgi:dGTPase
VTEHGYTDFDRERFLPEERRPGTLRGEFTRDRARVLHSSALRRLGAKTQVLSPSTGDFARTRLTHSLEVAQIGREMASDLGLDPDVVDLACLAHDLGHPPFGHNGERALNDWADSFGGFEGNAQTLRLLTRIEPKVFGPTGEPFGLNLTRASLDATCKYPWARLDSQVSGGQPRAKFGYYLDDKPVFDWMRRGADEGKSVEAMVMDFADDVAYSVHDFEDAIVSGYVNLRTLADPAEEASILRQASDWSNGAFSLEVLVDALRRLRLNTYWPESYNDSPSDLGRLKNLTSSLIGGFVQRTTKNSFAWAQEGEISRYGSNLVVPSDVEEEIAVLKGVVAAFLMAHESRRTYYEWQRAILTELSDALLAANGEHLDSYGKAAWANAFTQEQQYRVVVDTVACLTDQRAITMHHQLVTNAGKIQLS